jgi:hypothetical protein
MTSPTIDPPDGLPDSIVTTLTESSDGQLREIIHYAQSLLASHPPITEAIEERQAEELLQVKEQDGYTIAIVERPDETGADRGPFAYMVKWQPSIEGEKGGYHWHYLGRVHGDAAEAARD